MKKAYLVYPGLGKTTFAKTNSEFIDVQVRVFKDLSLKEYIETKKYPNYRGNPIKEINPDYPTNLIEYVKKEIKTEKIILMAPKQDAYDLLEALRITEFCFVMPDKERLKELEQDYLIRGDSLDYINRNIRKRYNLVIKVAKQMKKDIIFLKPGEYLADIIDK